MLPERAPIGVPGRDLAFAAGQQHRAIRRDHRSRQRGEGALDREGRRLILDHGRGDVDESEIGHVPSS